MLTDVHNQPKIVSVTSIQTPWDLSGEQDRTLQGPLGSDLQEYSVEFNNLQENIDEFNNLQEYTEEYNNLQEHIEEYSNLQEHTVEYNHLQEYTEEYNHLQEYTEEHVDGLENTESITSKHIAVKNEIFNENEAFLVIVKEEPTNDAVDIYEYDCQYDIHNEFDINEENYNNGLLELNKRIKKEFIDNILIAESSLVTGSTEKMEDPISSMGSIVKKIKIKKEDPISSMGSIVKKIKIKKSKKEDNDNNLSHKSNKPKTRSASVKNSNFNSDIQNEKRIILKFYNCGLRKPNNNKIVKATDNNYQNVSLNTRSKSKKHGNDIQKDNFENDSFNDSDEFHSNTSETESEDLLIEIPKKRKTKKVKDVTKAKKKYTRKLTITKVLKSCDENCRNDEFCTQSVECRRRNRIKNKNNESLRFQCTQCDFKCKTKKGLNTHSLTHSGETKYSCHLCDYRCIQKSHLDQHVRRHSMTKSYSCDHCDYTCVQKSQLDQHVRRHTKVKPFSCNICDYKCSQRCHLDQHMRRHTGVKPFSCELCDYKCTQRCHLDQHMRKHSGVKPFSCKFCKYKCIQLSQLNQHVKKKHNLINFK